MANDIDITCGVHFDISSVKSETPNGRHVQGIPTLGGGIGVGISKIFRRGYREDMTESEKTVFWP